MIDSVYILSFMILVTTCYNMFVDIIIHIGTVVSTFHIQLKADKSKAK